MADDKRPIYKIKRFVGLALGATAAGIAVMPGTIPKIAGAVLGFIASNVFSYGAGAASERYKNVKRQEKETL